MPLASHPTQSTGGYEQATASAGVMQIVAPEFPTALPASLLANTSWLSGLIFSNGYKLLSVGVTMDHAGTLKITRYIDLLGAIPQAVSSTAIVANTPLMVNLTDGLPFVTYQVEIDNAVGATGTITNFAILMNAG